MQYSNVPEKLPANVRYATFFSRLYNHDLGYCVYLPAGMKPAARRIQRDTIFTAGRGTNLPTSRRWNRCIKTVIPYLCPPNVSFELVGTENLPVEQMFFEELIPEIERKYRASGVRTLSGFFTGGGMAVWFALRHPGVFAGVVTYAGTFHHYYYKDYMIPFDSAERAGELYRGMLQARWEAERNLPALFDRQKRMPSG